MADEPIHANYASLDDLKSQLLNLGIALDNAGTAGVTPAAGSVTTGAGEFADQMGDGVPKFIDSWKLYFGAVSDDASIVGNSVRQAKIDFHAVDAAASLPHGIVL
jgi:hypothetical protein